MIASLSAILVVAQYAPAYSVGDPRIQVVPFDANQVVRIAVADGYATLIELSPDERIESVVVGASAVWQVTAGKQGDRLVVKPLPGATPTNMVVVTDLRRYVFALDPTGGAQGTPFVVHFNYPAPSGAAAIPATPLASSESVPATYRFSGDSELRPRLMADDGRRTSITWDATRPLPAVFAVDRGGRESLVNGRMVGERYVIEGTAQRYVFRLGRSKAGAVRVSPRTQR